ncbi:energy transducer TonB [Chryseobacterium antibioticum]|uniref:Energy transducer TonB n=1 Tax=Chryseobacterium pyrolae TaxID=2987481 RepID=A0ABT2IIP0_9FLAO|nr:energy transducer TonB [Chryseobacterium pyrolae]MCT2408500.1 energy transducer TonB [Chryseobacterium pyrolae]
MKSVKSQNGGTKPIHPKGDAFFKEELSKNMNIQNIQGKGQVTCKLIFIVEKDGSIIKAVGIGDNEKFNRYAELAILLTQDRWEPAKKDGLPVRAIMSVPLMLNFD